jgi:anti-sigma B factor antagonist
MLALEGDLDIESSPDLALALDELLAIGNSPVVIDLTRVRYVSSAGWGVFIARIATAKFRRDRIKLCGMNDTVREVFELLGLHHIMEAHDHVQDAISACRTFRFAPGADPGFDLD